MINSCTFIGNVGQTPEIKMVGETKLANFSIACNKTYLGQNGEKITKTEWIRLVAWRKLAEVVEKYITTGQQVYVEGELETRTYDKEGVTHYATSINVRTLKMLGGKREDRQEDHGREAQPRTNGGSYYQPPAMQSESQFNPNDDDLPF